MKKVLIVCLLFAGCQSNDAKFSSKIKNTRTVKRTISNTSMATPIANCVIVGRTEREREIVIQKSVVTNEQLSRVNEYNQRGIYFDVFATGGFRLYYSETSEGFEVTVDAEDTGVISRESFNSLPFVVHKETRIDLTKVVLNRVSLVCREE